MSPSVGRETLIRYQTTCLFSCFTGSLSQIAHIEHWRNKLSDYINGLLSDYALQISRELLAGVCDISYEITIEIHPVGQLVIVKARPLIVTDKQMATMPELYHEIRANDYGSILLPVA